MERRIEKRTINSSPGSVEDLIGRDLFLWISRVFNAQTTLNEIPDEIINRISSIDIASRAYQNDPKSLTAIAVITFAYKRAGRYQDMSVGPKDMLFMKVLAKKEKSRRKNAGPLSGHPFELPLCEIFAGEIGDRIRSVATMNCAV